MPDVHWKQTTTPVNGVSRTWVRSNKQTFNTGFGGVFSANVDIERVAVSAEGAVTTAHVTSISRRMDQLPPDQLAKAQQIQTLLTELVGTWMLEDEAAV